MFTPPPPIIFSVSLVVLLYWTEIVIWIHTLKGEFSELKQQCSSKSKQIFLQLCKQGRMDRNVNATPTCRHNSLISDKDCTFILYIIPWILQAITYDFRLWSLVPDNDLPACAMQIWEFLCWYTFLGSRLQEALRHFWASALIVQAVWGSWIKASDGRMMRKKYFVSPSAEDTF